MENINFDYYYGMEAEQFSFYKVPRILIKDPRFKKLSNDAKLLYGLMLDRLSLSMKNGWLDKDNRAYIHYTLVNVMEDLGCAREKGVKVMAELDSKKGIGLIEKKRQGLGRPDIIYVKNFTSLEEMPPDEPEGPQNSDIHTEVQKPDLSDKEDKNHRGSETRLQTNRKTNPNYTNNNYTEISYINRINQSESGTEKAEKKPARDAPMSEAEEYMQIIRENIDYDYFDTFTEYGDRELAEELYQIICDIVCVRRKSIRIGRESYPYELVKLRFLKLNNSHLKYVMGQMKNNTNRIENIRSYLITALYNAPSTINHFYQQEVQQDRYG